MRLRHVALFLTLLLIATPCLAKPVEIAISHIAQQNSPKALATEYLKKLLEERSSARIHVKIIENKTVTADQVLDALSRNQIQLALPEIRSAQRLLPVLQIYELPFLFDGRQQLHQTIGSEAGRQILRQPYTHNLIPLAIWDGATRQLLDDKTLATPGDNALQLFAAAQSADLNPHQDKHSWQEVTLSDADLQLEETNATATLTLTNHSIACSVLLANQEFWNSLPEDLKVITSGAVIDATLYVQELTEQVDKDSLKTLTGKENLNVYQLTAAERNQWQNKMQQLYSQQLDRVKLNIIDMITEN